MRHRSGTLLSELVEDQGVAFDTSIRHRSSLVSPPVLRRLFLIVPKTALRRLLLLITIGLTTSTRSVNPRTKTPVHRSFGKLIPSSRTGQYTQRPSGS